MSDQVENMRDGVKAMMGSIVGSLARVEVRPGDRFVLMTDGPVSEEEARRFNDAWNRFMGPDAPKIMILPDGTKLGVVGVDMSSSMDTQAVWIDASKAGPSRLVIDPDAPLGDVLRDVDGFEEWFNRIIAEGHGTKDEGA